MTPEEKQKALKAGKIAKEVRDWIKPQIKKGMLLIEIANMIDSKMEELGGKPAFPVSLAIDNVAAHFTPAHDDKTVAHGLLKVDFGAHIDGWISDNAFSIDLENNPENAKVIEASEEALTNALKTVKKGLPISSVGRVIEETITGKGLEPIRNLSGHSMEKFNLHAGTSVPNFDNNGSAVFEPGLYAIEPFATTGLGRVHDGKPTDVYQLVSEKNVRSPIAREILRFIIQEYNELPFSSTWIMKKFGAKTMFGLRELEQNGNLHHYNELVESASNTNNPKVAQTEHTILIDEDGKITVTTL